MTFEELWQAWCREEPRLRDRSKRFKVEVDLIWFVSHLAYETGYKAGTAAGHEAGRAEMEEFAMRDDKLARSIRRLRRLTAAAKAELAQSKCER